MASTPPLVMMPERTADAGAGATGWAVGSHACMGIMPALAPKPTIIRKYTFRSRGRCSAARRGFSAPPPVKRWTVRKWDRKKYPASAMPAPKTEYPRYFSPARRAAGVPLCSTSGTVSSVIISKNI